MSDINPVGDPYKKIGRDETEQENIQKTDKSIVALETKLAEIKDERDEERFCWIIIVFILFDAFIFTLMNNWGAPVSIVVLQVVLLVILARRMGVEDLTNWFDKFIHSRSKK